MNKHLIHVNQENAGLRLDKFIAQNLSHLSRSRVQQLIAESNVQNSCGINLDASYKVKAGQEIIVIEPAPKSLELEPENIALDIIFEDENLLVINKPVGMTVHPAPGAESGTLVHALLAYCRDSLSGIGGVMRPGIVHRLDKYTSGLLIVAKNDLAHQHLSAQLKDRSLTRNYIAYCWGVPRPTSQIIDAAIDRHPKDRKKMAIVEGGREAITGITTIESYLQNGVAIAAKIECKLATGRTHQIRVHAQHIGCSLIGDNVYGINTGSRINRIESQYGKLSPEFIEHIKGFKRQALHAARIAFIHPITAKELEFNAPLPADLIALEDNLKRHF